jgi:outer membrane protein assembly factor BamA
MRRLIFLLPAVLAVVIASRPATAQKFIPKSIQFQGDPEYSDAELMAASGLKLGEVLTRDNMNDTAKKLMATGVFDQLTYKFDGQDLIFSMTPSTELFPVRIDNLPITPGPALDAELHSRFPLYHGKVPSEGTLLDDVRGAFEQILAAEGIKANVTVVPYGERKVHNKVTAMNFTVQSPPVRLGVIQFQGESPTMLQRLQAIAQHVADSSFDSNSTPADLANRFTSFYQNMGYAAVRVKVAQSGNPVMGADAIQIPELVTVDEGKIYKVAAVRVPADCLVTQDEANKMIAADSDGLPGSNFRKLLVRIDEQYKSKGYLDLLVTPHPEFDETASTVNYAIEITPGAVYHVAYVKFENVSDELRAHLMRAWQLMPGEPFDMTYVENFTTKAMSQDPALKRTLAGVLTRYETSADPVTHEVDLVIRLEKP